MQKEYLLRYLRSLHSIIVLYCSTTALSFTKKCNFSYLTRSRWAWSWMSTNRVCGFCKEFCKKALNFNWALVSSLTTYCSILSFVRCSFSKPSSNKTPKERHCVLANWNKFVLRFFSTYWHESAPECQRWERVCWYVTSEGGTQIRKSTFSKEPKSRFWVLESAMEQTWESNFWATVSWKGWIWCRSRL